MTAAGIALVAALFTWAAWLVRRSEQIAAGARHADPHAGVDFQARFEADQKKEDGR